ncbi:MAG: hypothetical protein HYT87_05750 [Nitrospirae bacterium]|nr:hypothetical protein [Nitrospirota bacterium]
MNRKEIVDRSIAGACRAAHAAGLLVAFLITLHSSLVTRLAFAGEAAAGRKAPQMELKCDQVGETLRCESEGMKFEMVPPRDADLPKASGRDLKEAYVKGYKRGLQEAATLREELTQAEHYVWKRPIVQKVWMPPMIVSGVFLPGHHEFVLLKPGEWNLAQDTAKEEK